MYKVLTLVFGFALSSIYLSAQQLAFPTAEEAGKYTIGGRGDAIYIFLWKRMPL
jgi:hypothetical protein